MTGTSAVGARKRLLTAGFIGVGAIHVVLEFRKLAGAFHALAFHEVGDVDLLVAVGGLGIQQEIDQRAFEAGAFSSIDHKPGAGGADAVVPVDQAVLEGELDVVLRLGEVGLGSPFADDRVGRLVAADRAGFVGEVRDVEQQVVLLGGGVLRLHVERGDLLVDGADLGLDGGGVLALGLEHADLLGNGFPRVLELLLGGFQRAAGLVAGEHVVDEFPVVAAPGFEAVLDGGGVVADDADVEHGGTTLTGDGGRNQREFSPNAGLRRRSAVIFPVRRISHTSRLDRREWHG